MIEAAQPTSLVLAQLTAPPELDRSGTGKLFLSKLKQASGKIAVEAALRKLIWYPLRSSEPLCQT